MENMVTAQGAWEQHHDIGSKVSFWRSLMVFVWFGLKVEVAEFIHARLADMQDLAIAVAACVCLC